MRNLFGYMFCMLLFACGGSSDSGQSATQSAPAAPKDDGKGIGEITEVALNDPLDQEMVARGQEIYDLKCSACHKLTGQRVVGPGFLGVTERRKPEWIMNMITNTDAMLEKDPQAQALLEECLTRMPNQNVALNEARDILEFFLSNDQSKK
ncbi:MAG: c-type cytochrome [Saprospiraceae bacterium]|nr:c-type cytochrome [Saprospiraceae bacterium]